MTSVITREEGGGYVARPDGTDDRVFHDLLMTGVRNLIKAGVSQKIAMQISGHKTDEIFDGYDITDEDDLIDAMESVIAMHEVKPEQQPEPPRGEKAVRGIERLTK